MSNIPLKIAVIGGSGLGETFAGAEGVREVAVETPFGPPSAPVLAAEFDGVEVLLLRRHGVGHTLNPSRVPYRANVFALKVLGVTHVLASGAVGSLREEYAPRDLVIPDQIIDRTKGVRPATFYDAAAVHVEFADPFCPVLRRLLIDAGSEISNLGSQIHDRAAYVCMEGPAFSTRSESHAHRLLGGDLIGMTLVPEAKLAREAELPYAAACLVTDYDCWRPRPEDAPAGNALLAEIIGHLKQATANASALIRAAVSLAKDRQDDLSKCPAADALRLGIWSDKSALDPAEVDRLRPLWGRHF